MTTAAAITRQIVDRNAEVAGAERAVDQIGAVERPRIGAPEESENVLEHQHQRESEQQLEALVAAIDAAQHTLDRRTDEAEQDPGDNKAQAKSARARGRAGSHS